MSFSFPRNYDVDGTIASELPRASFDGIEFPYTDLSVKGGLRYAQHEFPHSPGAEIEKMGRRPYTITFKAWFHDVPGSPLSTAYPGLHSRLEELRDKFEKERTADLVVPTIGTIRAVATEWTQQFDPRVSSGETFELTFIEDQDLATLKELVDIPDAQAVISANDDLQAAVMLAKIKSSIFQQINDAITAVQGVFGMADAMSNLVAGKLHAVSNLCAYADSQVEEMQDPVNHVVVEALKHLWSNAQQAADNILSSAKTMRHYTTPKTMSVNQIAVQLFGSSEKGFELLQMNDFADPMEIPAGTDVKYLADG